MSPSPSPSHRRAHILLWVGQGVLAALFGMAGLMKATAPIADLTAQLKWPGDIPPELVRFVGTAEFLGALGLVLPSALRIAPKLTPLAALGLATIMALAAGFHTMRGEGMGPLAINLVLGSVAAAIAWGRTRVAPIEARG